MHPHRQQIQTAIASLKNAHSDLSNLLSDSSIEGIRTRVLHGLETQINYLSAQVNADSIQTSSSEVQPLTKLFGKSLANVPATGEEKVELKVVLKTPEQIAADELREKVTELYSQFETIETPAILDTYDEMEIRGVGKLAGLPVTETTPKKVDAKFVEQIKEAIKKKKELEAAGNTGGSDKIQS